MVIKLKLPVRQGVFVMHFSRCVRSPAAALCTPEQGGSKVCRNLYCNHRLLHQSWARPETEIYQKIHNWSHNTDVDAEGYFNFWKSTNRHNAPFLRDFHPFPQCRATWHTLKFIPGDIDDIIASLRNDYQPSNKLAPKQYIKAVVKRVLRQLHIRRNPV